jgi:hypothetical protein
MMGAQHDERSETSRLARLRGALRPADAAVLVFYLLLTAVSLWPLLTAMTTSVPHSIRDPGFQATVLDNVTRRLLTLDVAHIFDGYFYYPAHLTLAMADDQIGLQVFALPLHLVGADALLVLNLLTVLSFPVTAVCGDLLGRYVTRSRVGGLVVGTAFAFAAFRIEHVIHLQLLQSWTVALAFLGLEMTLREQRRRGPVIWGFALVTAAATSLNYLLLLALVQPVYVAVRFALARDRRDVVAHLRRLVRPAVAAGALCLALLVPYVVLRLHGYSRGSSDTFQFSARLGDYLTPAADSLALHGLFTTLNPATGIDERELFPGAAVLVFMLVGIAVALIRREWGRLRHMTPWLVIGVLSVLFSLGPYLWPNAAKAPANVSGLLALPYHWLARPLLLESLRSPARFGLIALLAVAVVGAMAVTRLLAHVPRGSRRTIAILALAAVLAVDYSASVPVEAVPWGPQLPATYGWLRSQPAGPVADLPATGVVVSYYMMASTVDGHPRLGGWSGFLPHQLSPIRKVVTTANLDLWLTAARRLGAAYIFVHGDAMDPAVVGAIHTARDAGRLVLAASFGQDEVYGFGTPAPSASPAPLPSASQ